MADHYRIEMGFNWNRVLERESAHAHYLDHYCIAQPPAAGEPPSCSTMRLFEPGDEVEFAVFRLLDDGIDATPHRLEVLFMGANVGSSRQSPISPMEGRVWHDCGAPEPVGLESWSFGPTAGAWQTPNRGFVIDTPGRFLFNARLLVEAQGVEKLFVFDPEMIVGEGTHGGEEEW